METPKPKGGRPRRRPYAAHDARAVRIRANRARSALLHLRWCLDGRPEVYRHWVMCDPAFELHLRRQLGPMVLTIDHLIASLADPISPDEGQADA